MLLFADALPPWPEGVPLFPWLWPTEPDRSVVLVTDSTVVVVVVVVAVGVVVVAVALPRVAVSVLVRLIGFDRVFGSSFRALCTRFRLCTALVVAFSLAREGFTVSDLACVVWAWPCAATLDETE